MIAAWLYYLVDFVGALDSADVEVVLLGPDLDSYYSAVEVLTNYRPVGESLALLSFDSFFIVFEASV